MIDQEPIKAFARMVAEHDMELIRMRMDIVQIKCTLFIVVAFQIAFAFKLLGH